MATRKQKFATTRKRGTQRCPTIHSSGLRCTEDVGHDGAHVTRPMHEYAEVRENRRRDADLATAARQLAARDPALAGLVAAADRDGRGDIMRRKERSTSSLADTPSPLETDFANPVIERLVTLSFQSLTDKASIFVLGDVVLESEWYNSHMLHYGYSQEGNRKCASHPEIIKGVAAEPNVQWARAVLASLFAEVGPYLPAHPSNKPIHRYTLAFPVMTIPAGSTARASVNPDIVFRGQQLVLPLDDNELLSITVERLMVAHCNAIVGSEGLPGMLFAANSRVAELYMQTATPANAITLELRNHSAVPITVRPALRGISAPYSADPTMYGSQT